MMNGGGVTMLSAQMLDRTTFYTGAFPAHIGNLLSGAVDMGLRNGNMEEHEYTAQASLLGLDFSAEGPLTKKHNSSFLANYRYSTVGLLSQAGVDFGDESIGFQDLSFNLHFDNGVAGRLSVFGFAGNSKNVFDAKPVDERETAKDWSDIEYKAGTYALGATYDVALSKLTRLSAGLAYSASEQTRTAFRYDDTETRSLEDDYFSDERRWSSFLRIASRIGEQSEVEFGANVSSYNDSLYNLSIYPSFVYDPQLCPDGCSSIQTDGILKGILLQPYANLAMTLSEKAKLSAGFRYTHFGYNNSGAAEPRLALHLNPTIRSELTFSYSVANQIQRLPVYLAENNEGLGLSQLQAFNASYLFKPNTDIKVRMELFYQLLDKVPVQRTPTTFSVLNTLENVVPGSLTGEGKGTNAGVDILLEKYFYGNQYFWLGGSFYQSTYEPGDGEVYDSRFNGNYTFTAVYGKEWYSAAKNRTISLSTRALWLGGLREMPIDLNASRERMETVYDYDAAYDNVLKDYTRLDLRLSFRKNKPGYTRTFAIDIQNLFSLKNEAYHYFDFITDQVETQYQLGIIPMLIYRIDF
jgi:hypothetical protein